MRTELWLIFVVLLIGAGCNKPPDSASVTDPEPLVPPVSVTPEEGTFVKTIHNDLPPYAFRVVSFTETSEGYIEIYHGNTTSTPLQVIPLDPNMGQRDHVAHFFRMDDINFDGYTDIGVFIDGSGKWASFQYWLYDTISHTFATSTFTDEFRKITFHDLEFDTKKKQITANHLCSFRLCEKQIYKVENGHLLLLEEYFQAPIHREKDIPPDCIITLTKHTATGVVTSTKLYKGHCPGV